LVKWYKSAPIDKIATPFFILYALILGSCSDRDAKKFVEPVYDKQTGRLTLLKYDSNKNGVPDTFSYMDGTKVLRIEIDKDEDGKIDRWEYYDADQKLIKVGFSRENDGREDAWSYSAPDGSVARIEISTRRDGKVTRTEYYEKDTLVRAEEDTDEDGRIDKWDAYAIGRLASVAFDTAHRGFPDRRLLYAADGSGQVEVDPDGTGHFTPAAAPKTAPRR
jgi:hypothetical protein